jgi:hypothetical protein
VIYMQCEFIPCINLVTSIFMMLCNGFLYTYIIIQMNQQWMYGNRLSGEFITGLQGFLRVADANRWNGFSVCPCSVYKNQKDYSGLQGFLCVADANRRNGFSVCPCSVCKNQKDYSSPRTS